MINDRVTVSNVRETVICQGDNFKSRITMLNVRETVPNARKTVAMFRRH